MKMKIMRYVITNEKEEKGLIIKRKGDKLCVESIENTTKLKSEKKK